MASGGLTCVKYLTFICNLLFALSGILILLVGAMVQFNYSHYSNFVSDHIWTAPIILMVVGAVVAFICFLGCCGALKENSCMILSFAVLALIVFFFEIGLGIAGYIKHTGLQHIMETQFNNTMKHYNDREDYRDGWTLLQTELVCCGTFEPTDWETVFPNKTIPSSCCPVINLNEAEVCTVAHANPGGCLPKLLGILDSKTLVLAGVVLAVAGIQDKVGISGCQPFGYSQYTVETRDGRVTRIVRESCNSCVIVLTILFACCLYRSFRRTYQTV